MKSVFFSFLTILFLSCSPSKDELAVVDFLKFNELLSKTSKTKSKEEKEGLKKKIQEFRKEKPELTKTYKSALKRLAINKSESDVVLELCKIHTPDIYEELKKNVKFIVHTDKDLTSKLAAKYPEAKKLMDHGVKFENNEMIFYYDGDFKGDNTEFSFKGKAFRVDKFGGRGMLLKEGTMSYKSGKSHLSGVITRLILE